MISLGQISHQKELDALFFEKIIYFSICKAFLLLPLLLKRE